MGRLLYAVAASAVICGPAAAEHAEPRAVIKGDLDPELRTAIERVVGDTDRPIENRFEARRRARAAAEDAIAVLRSEGYYGYAVEPDISEGDPPQPLVQITPGRRFVLGPAGIAWQGEEPDAASADAARTAIALTPGAPGRAGDVVAAEGRIVAAMQSRGYADVAAQPREVIVDHADFTVKPTYKIAAGRLVRLDGLEISAGGRTRPDWVRRLAPWTSGDTYKPTDVAELERRLLDTGVYESVTVAVAPADKATADGLRPVVVSLSERDGRSIESGASYDTEDGFGVNVRWNHYNRLHRADTISYFGQISDRDSRVGVELSLPHWRRAQQTFKTRAQVYRVRTDAYDEEGAGLEADITRRYGRTSYVTVGASVDATQTKEPTLPDDDGDIETPVISTLGRDLITFGTLGDVLLDRSNDPLNPTSGWKVSARLEPTLILGDTNLPYLRVVGQGSYYFPLEKQAKTVLAARVRVGRIINGTVDQIPASQRFYAGGGGSVRGFAYQAVGPQIDDDTPQGGTFLFESSFEVRRDLTPKWGFAVFADAGAVGSAGSIDFDDDLAVGVGVGVRYNLGFAPIRVDIATPVVNRRDGAAYQIYVSIGQSF